MQESERYDVCMPRLISAMCANKVEIFYDHNIMIMAKWHVSDMAQMAKNESVSEMIGFS